MANGATYQVNTGFGSPRFSKVELRDITISVLVLALSFTLIYVSRNNRFIMTAFEHFFGEGTVKYVGLFLTSVVLVVISFLLHELGHKFVAQKHGLWSEYRMFPAGLIFSVILSFAGFLFAAPGAVMIAANQMDPKTNGKISIAGPAVNIVFAAIGLIGCFAFNGNVIVVPFFLLASLNASLALFNLIPIPPLDGSKIFRWNIGIWIAALAVAAAEFILLFRMGLYYTL